MTKTQSKIKGSERRISKRFSIQVLVTCVKQEAKKKTKKSAKAATPPAWEMWAQDLGDDGVGLRWSRSWAASRSLLSASTLSRRASDSSPKFDNTTPLHSLRKGQKVHLEGLVYGDEGPVLMDGIIQWVHPSKDGSACDFGIAIVSPDHRSFFRALKG